MTTTPFPQQIISRTAPLIEYLKAKRENQRLAKTVEIATTLVFISFFIVVAIKPTMSAISALLGEIKSKEILSKSMKTKITQVMKAQDQFSQIQERYLVVNSALPDSPEYVQASTQILGAAQESQVLIDKLQFEVDSNKSTDQKTPVNTNLKDYTSNFGVYSNFNSGVKFLSTLYQNRRLFKIIDVYISPQKDKTNKDTDPNKLIFRYNIDLFHWQQNND